MIFSTVFFDRFTKAMIFSLNYVRLRANDISVVNLYENPDQILPITFKFETIMFNKNLAISSGQPTKDAKALKAMRQQMKRYANNLIILYFEFFFLNQIYLLLGFSLKKQYKL